MRERELPARLGEKDYDVLVRGALVEGVECDALVEVGARRERRLLDGRLLDAGDGERPLAGAKVAVGADVPHHFVEEERLRLDSAFCLLAFLVRIDDGQQMARGPGLVHGGEDPLRLRGDGRNEDFQGGDVRSVVELVGVRVEDGGADLADAPGDLLRERGCAELRPHGDGEDFVAAEERCRGHVPGHVPEFVAVEGTPPEDRAAHVLEVLDVADDRLGDAFQFCSVLEGDFGKALHDGWNGDRLSRFEKCKDVRLAGV